MKDAIEKLNNLHELNDPEEEHLIADDILLSLVPQEVREAYEKASARFWWA